jgi:hypothetical protein
MTEITKITLEEFITNTDWECKDKQFWKELFKGTHEWWSDENKTYWMFQERSSEVWEALKHLRYVPYYKDGELHLSEAMTLQKLIKRLRYVLRGNTIPNYGIEFKEVKRGYGVVTIDGVAYKEAEGPSGTKKTFVKDSVCNLEKVS